MKLFSTVMVWYMWRASHVAGATWHISHRHVKPGITTNAFGYMAYRHHERYFARRCGNKRLCNRAGVGETFIP